MNGTETWARVAQKEKWHWLVTATFTRCGRWSKRQYTELRDYTYPLHPNGPRICKQCLKSYLKKFQGQ